MAPQGLLLKHKMPLVQLAKGLRNIRIARKARGKKITAISLLVFSLSLPAVIFAETIVLKSGEAVEGKIIERTDKYIKIDLEGIPATYFLDDIESVDGIKPVAINITSDDPEVLVSYWTEAVRKDSKDYVAYNNLGMAYISSGQYPEAVRCFLKSLDINPHYEMAYANLGFLYNKLGQYEQAVSYIKKSIEIDPNNAQPYNNLGSAYAGQEKFDEAVPLYKKAIQLDPEYADAYANLGYAYVALKQYEAGIENMHKAVQKNPQDAASYSNLGYAYYILNRYQESRDNFQKAKELFLAYKDEANAQMAEEWLNKIPDER